MSIKLNIGAGHTEIDGFIPIDRMYGLEAYPLPAEVTRDGETYQLADGSVDEIRASHILEHFAFDDVPHVLGEWSRVLKPGGRLRIAVPDTDFISQLPDTDPKKLRYLMGGQTDENDYHKSAFTEETLRRHMVAAGLTEIDRWESANTDCASLPVSLNLEGLKGEHGPATAQDIKIAAVVSIPRLGWNDHWGCVVDALSPWKIPIRRFTGAFWGQCMQNILETCVRDELDWVLTLDYDTMFTANDIDRMFGTLGSHPEIDALCALQSRRNHDTPLMTVVGEDGVPLTKMPIDGSPVKSTTAHFGLTLIRVDALRKMKKPWFVGVPGPDGTWTHEKHIDEDIYFWKKWQEMGNTLYVAPTVRVGHLEVVVSEFDENMDFHFTRMTEWRDRVEDAV